MGMIRKFSPTRVSQVAPLRPSGRINVSDAELVSRIIHAAGAMSRTLTKPSAADPIGVRDFYKQAVDYVVANRNELAFSTETMIDLNGLVCRGEMKGSFRRYLYDHQRMDVLSKWLASEGFVSLLRKNLWVEAAEAVHAKMIEIHPFEEGNGRVALLVADLVMLKAGLLPFAHHDRAEYFRLASPFDRANRRPEGEIVPDAQTRLHYFKQLANM